MDVYIHDLATAVPPTVYSQELVLANFLARFGADRRVRALLERIYARSGIRERHSVVRDLAGADDEPLYFRPGAELASPTTAERNELCVRAARELGLDVARRLLGGSFAAADVTHVVTVSCTGFSAPGLDFTLVDELGLGRGTHRYHIGFMGCFAAFQGLQLARAFCAQDPGAVVLLVCVELCSLHLQIDTRPDNLVAASLFADGAAGAIVSARPPRAPTALRMDAFASRILPDRRADMSWTIGDNGFEMLLSKYVPSVIGLNVDAAIRPLLERANVDLEDVDWWAVHPGGRAVLDTVAAALELGGEQIADSRHVLAHYGNMSSPTVLFVLHRLLERVAPGTLDRRIVALAFGPGLTIESGVLTTVGGACA